jgi:hypothetical protein
MFQLLGVSFKYDKRTSNVRVQCETKGLLPANSCRLRLAALWEEVWPHDVRVCASSGHSNWMLEQSN